MFILVHETQTFWENRRAQDYVMEHLVNLTNVEDFRKRSDGKTQINFASGAVIVADETFEELKRKVDGNIVISMDDWIGKEREETT